MRKSTLIATLLGIGFASAGLSASAKQLHDENTTRYFTIRNCTTHDITIQGSPGHNETSISAFPP